MIYLDRKEKKPLYQQLYEAIIAEIHDGTLKTDDALKPIRFLADELNISLNTVQKAYQQLLAEGYIRSVPGSGYYVEDVTNSYLSELDSRTDLTHANAVPSSHPGLTETKLAPISPFPIRYDFKHDAVFSQLFPWKTWRRCVNTALLKEKNNQTIRYESNQGNLELRTQLCQILHRNRGVNCTPDQIIMAPGTQYAMEIICRLLPASQHRIAYEEPAHNGMRNIFLQNGYDITSIPVRKHGIDVHALTKTDCNLLYVMPSHQFPTGRTIPVSSRYRLLEWAVKRDAFIIENDYDSDFTYQSRPIPALQGLDKYGHVIYFNTLSKILTPSMRIAFFILPLPLLEIYREMYRYFNSALPTYHQIALTEFMASGDFERHLRKIIRSNEKKCGILIDSIRTCLNNWMEIIDTPAGSHIIVRIRACHDADWLINKLHERQIAIYGVKEYFHTTKAPEDIFLLGFSSMSENEIPIACTHLASALGELLGK